MGDGEETAVTLEKKINLCGREMYSTRVKNIFVALLGREEGFLENEKLRINEVDKEIIHAAEVRSALSSVELSQDSIYQEYELEADVKKIEAFISLSENKLIIPNKLEIERTRNFKKERFVDMAAYRNNKIENEDIFLETYQDLAYGTIT